MSIIPENVRAARKRIGLSQQQLADAAGVGQSTIDKIESGQTRASRFIAKIAAALRVDPSELDSDFAPGSILSAAPQIIPGHELVGDKDFPIYAAAEGGPGTMIIDSDPLEYARRPAPLENTKDGYGITVVGSSMEPVYEPGDVALVHPRLPIIPGTDVVLYADSENGEVRAAIKRLIKLTETTWFLRQWNPPEGEKQDFQLDRREWGKCHRVVGKYSRR